MMERTLVVVGSLAIASLASAQWDPSNGQWGKTDPTDLRVMTWNVQDMLCRNNQKVENRDDWTACARIVAAMKPDVLLMQECSDNSGNGSSGGLDSVSQAETTADLFLHGGTDPFLGGAVTAYVQAYDAAFDLPFVYVSSDNDGFNRNVIFSRYPFADLNGDGLSTYADFLIFADQYAPGGDGGIRGFGFAEIDLPDGTYAGDLLIGNSHLKAGSTQSDKDDRQDAAKNIAYFLDYNYNGAGTGVPNSSAKLRFPVGVVILDANTPIVWGGDWNEDEDTNGQKGPAEWMALAQVTDGFTDGSDRDGSDSTLAHPTDVFTGNDATLGSSRLDYVCYQDSIATLRRGWVFNSANIPSGGYPPEIIGFFGGAASTSSWASDHRPIVVDLILPTNTVNPPGAFSLSLPADASVGVDLEPTLEWTASAEADTYDVVVATDAGLSNVVFSGTGLATTSTTVPVATLVQCSEYYWGVTAVNAGGSTASTPTAFSFTTDTIADMNGDGMINGIDVGLFLQAYGTQNPSADVNNDGMINGIDVGLFLQAYGLCS